MKSRSKEMLDRSLAATISAIEIFNKPDFMYREETFAILVINAWELLLKAKWLSKNNNKLRSLYVLEDTKNKSGKVGRRKRVKLTKSKNPFTHNLDFIAKKLVESKELNSSVWRNIQMLQEIRDSAVHFYNHGNIFSIRLQEIGAASIRNYTFTTQDWFNVDFTKYNLYMLPIGFIPTKENIGIVLNQEEKRFLKFLEAIEKQEETDPRFSVSISIDVSFSKSKAADSLKLMQGNSPITVDIKLTEEEIQKKYPLSHKTLTAKCYTRYKSFKQTQSFHQLLRELKCNTKHCYKRELTPGNPKSQKTYFYSEAIFSELDKHYGEHKQE